MDRPRDPAKKPDKEVEEDLDEALENSFPASDPPSMTDPHRSTVKKKPTPSEVEPPADQKTAD